MLVVLSECLNGWQDETTYITSIILNEEKRRFFVQDDWILRSKDSYLSVIYKVRQCPTLYLPNAISSHPVVFFKIFFSGKYIHWFRIMTTWDRFYELNKIGEYRAPLSRHCMQNKSNGFCRNAVYNHIGPTTIIRILLISLHRPTSSDILLRMSIPSDTIYRPIRNK